MKVVQASPWPLVRLVYKKLFWFVCCIVILWGRKGLHDDAYSLKADSNCFDFHFNRLILYEQT